jgi:hypothetical protein
MVVLPYPAGATTVTSEADDAARSLLTRAVLGTASGGTAGTAVFDSRKSKTGMRGASSSGGAD